jgi:hypothetical protein
LKPVLDKQRVDAFIKNVRAEYDNESIIKKGLVVKSRESRSSDPFSFIQVGVRYLADSAIFHDSSYYPGMLGSGRSIAIGEERYLVEKLLNSRDSKHITEASLSATAISKAFRDMGPNFHPKAVFVPLAFHFDLHVGKLPGVALRYDRSVQGRAILDCGLGEAPRVFWSNKYVPFHGLIFVDETIGEWIVKTTDKHWLMVDIRPTKEETKVDVTVKTIAYFDISNPTAELVLDVPTPKAQQ